MSKHLFTLESNWNFVLSVLGVQVKSVCFCVRKSLQPSYCDNIINLHEPLTLPLREQNRRQTWDPATALHSIHRCTDTNSTQASASIKWGDWLCVCSGRFCWESDFTISTAIKKEKKNVTCLLEAEFAPSCSGQSCKDNKKNMQSQW